MPTYKSVLGKWVPANEKVVSKEFNKVLYEGPDREAKKELESAGEEYFGIDFRQDPEFLERVRSKGYKDADEYLRVIGFQEEKEVEKIEKKAEDIKEPKKKRKLLNNFNGGEDMANPSNSKYGGFKEAPTV